MRTTIDQPRSIKARVFLWVLVLVALTLLLWALLPRVISQVQPTANQEFKIDPITGAITIDGVTLEAGVPVAPGWSENHSALIKFKLGQNGKKFRALPIEKIEAEVNGETVTLPLDSVRRNDDPIKVLFMIDRSGSMINKEGGLRADKLEAAKESLHYFIDHLAEADQAEIYSFDLEQTPVVHLTSYKRELSAGIDTISSRDKNTSLYESIRFALARPIGSITGIVFLTDGKEYNRATTELLAQRGIDMKTFKQEKEKELADIAREKVFPFYSIAIGEDGSQSDLGVDYQTLKNISENSNGGTATPVDTRKKLNTQELATKLTEVLADIKREMEFDYDLPVPMSNLKPGDGEIKLFLTINKGDGNSLLFPIVYRYSWNSGPPTFSKGKGLQPRWIERPYVPASALTEIYLMLLSMLILLSLAPSVLNKLSTAMETNRIGRAIQLVAGGSQHEGEQCPNEMGPTGRRYLFRSGDPVLVCPKCTTVHHLGCWQYNDHRCMNHMCEYQFVVPPAILAKYGITPVTRGRFV